MRWLVRAISEWDCTVRWSTKLTPRPPSFVDALLWDGVVRQKVLLADAGPVGLAQITDHHGLDASASLELLVDPTQREVVAAALGAFLTDSFRLMGLRVLSIAAAEDELDIDDYVRAHESHRTGRLPRRARRSTTTFVDILLHEVR